MTNNGKPKSPCYRCEDRTAECHAECMKYKAWTIIAKQANENMNKERTRDKVDPRQGNMTFAKKNWIRKHKSK